MGVLTLKGISESVLKDMSCPCPQGYSFAYGTPADKDTDLHISVAKLAGTV